MYITNTPLQIATSEGAIVLSTTTGNINNQSLPQVTQRAILGVPGGVKLASISQNQPLPTAGGHNNKPIDDAVVADKRPGILRKRETETQQNGKNHTHPQINSLQPDSFEKKAFKF